MPLLLIQFPDFDPVLVQIGPFAIRWYALAYIFGILLGWLFARALIRSERLWGGPPPMKALDFDDFVLWVTLGIILGGRTGYVLFTIRRISSPTPPKSSGCGKAACRSTADSPAACLRSCCSRGAVASPSFRSATLPVQSGRSGCFLAELPISSTANCGAGRPTFHGPWFSEWRSHPAPPQSVV
jgi:hypothetical protein